MVTKYKIVYAARGPCLEDEVNELIKEGWAPVGGVQIMIRGGGRDNHFYQSMVLESEPYDVKKLIADLWDTPMVR